MRPIIATRFYTVSSLFILLMLILTLAQHMSQAQEQCRVSPFQRVNVRADPSTTSAIVGALERNDNAIAIAQDTDTEGNTWWQLDSEGWVRFDTVSETGPCNTLPTPELLDQPPTSTPPPPPTATATAPSTLTPTPTLSPTPMLPMVSVEDPAEGVLRRGQPERWTFLAQRGDQLDLYLFSADFDTYLELYSPGGVRIAENDDSPIFAEGTNARLQDVTLETTGRYEIVVRGYYGDAAGPYTLTLALSSPEHTDVETVVMEGEADVCMMDPDMTPLAGTAQDCMRDAINGLLRVECFCADTVIVLLSLQDNIAESDIDCIQCTQTASDNQMTCTIRSAATLEFVFDLIEGDTVTQLCLPQ